ncbi:hypothetical protein HPB49_021959 [Dermacentor silvarum]|uniref:Uncharacterized protein n=1 Tax=Dermacentor silvarum TaxID=543639 RepID=A0ACB8E3G1_DERSI|nr:hypothetical protein HPB49_021959 [Dermacentor silvarum]
MDSPPIPPRFVKEYRNGNAQLILNWYMKLRHRNFYKCGRSLQLPSPSCLSATVQFEDCIREAVRLSGCHHEVDYLVTLMMTKTRELLSHMYSTNCWYRCSPAAAASTPFAPAGLVAVVLVVLWRT